MIPSEEPSLKRIKSSSSSSHTRRDGDQGASAEYLNCFAKENPIAVVVAPLRQRQGAILARNLSEAGAHVIETVSELEYRDGNPVESELLIVTDCKSRAEAWVGPTHSRFRKVCYVSTKWASKVLFTQSRVPIDSYVLGDPIQPLSGFPSSPPKSTPEKDVVQSVGTRPFLPVWCERRACQTGDVAEKVDILSRMPPYLCERSTVTQCIYPAPNRDLCKILEQMAKKRVLEQAGGSNAAADIRARAYRLASAALKCVPFKLKTLQDAQTLYSFGPRVLAVVNEFLTTGEVHEVSMLLSDVRLRTLSSFEDMYGIGPTTARELYDKRGIKSVQQLRERVSTNPSEFSEVLVEYLRHYDNLQRTNLANAVKLKQRVEDIANQPGANNLHLRFVLCGGFRRGEQSGHDVDLLYCRQSEWANDHSSVLEELVRRLQRDGVVVSVLLQSSNMDGWHEKRYHREASQSVYRYAHDVVHGLAAFGGRTFRLDVVGVRDAAEFPFATLAWSGSTAFQRDIRLACEKKHDWIFNQHGLFERAGGRRVDLQPFPKSEMDVFHAIGLVYRAPFERSC